jgi:transposase
MTIEGATNTEVFGAYVREVLIPALRPGDIVVMDNLGAHKSEHTLSQIRRAGAEVRFLPAYSPDLNPIEMMWSKVKALLRKAQARSHPELLQAIAAALSAVTAQDALGWFAACGYNFI